MGTFGKSLERELGKNTGKVISNFIFGDSWSTPYRRVSQPSPSAQLRAETTRMNYEAKMAEVNVRKQLAEEQSRIKQMELQSFEENRRQERLLSIDTAVLENVDKISAIQVPHEENEILAILEFLTPNMQNVQWKKGEEGEIRNKYANALLAKYTSLVKVLSLMNSKTPMFSYYKDILKNAYQRMVNNSSPYSLCLSSDEDILVTQLYSIFNIIRNRGWREKESSSFINLLDPYGLWFRTDNKETESYYDIFEDGLETMMEKYPDNKQLGDLIDAKYKLSFTRFFHKHKSLVIGYVYILCICILCSVLSFFLDDIFPISCFVASLPLLLFICIPLVIFIVSLIKKRNLKKSISLLQTKQIHIEKETMVAIEKRTDKSESITEDKLIDDDKFFDLNENERIDICLKKIWEKYDGFVHPSLIERKPIFAAYGVKNSILFVGVNPSYFANDENVFLHSNSNKTLLYGSFYQRDDAPQYFKSLETFASKCGYAYTQINLLYARENDRDFLLKQNSEFIREQLELSYDTILRINPVAIVFFTNYCNRLIFGANRWIDPTTENNGAYILKGTKIPVFFSEDISTLNTTQQEELIRLIKMKI